MEPDKQSYEAPRIKTEFILNVSAGSVIEGDPYRVESMDPLEAKALGLDSPLE